MYLLYFLLDTLKNIEYSSLINWGIEHALRKFHLEIKQKLINWPTFLSPWNSEKMLISTKYNKQEKKIEIGQAMTRTRKPPLIQ